MMYSNRADAGRALGAVLLDTPGPDPVVLGLPRGGVAVGAEVAAALGAELDVIVVRKIGVPSQPELAMGAIGEGGVLVVNRDVVRAARVTPDAFDEVRREEEAELMRRAEVYRRHRPRVALEGRAVVIVDDGVATGSTARAACQVASAAGAARVTLAVPVGPPGLHEQFAAIADEVVCLESPRSLFAIGQAYGDFSPTTDDEVIALLAANH